MNQPSSRIFLLACLLLFLSHFNVFAAELEDAIPEQKPSGEKQKLNDCMENSLRDIYYPLATGDTWDQVFFVYPDELSSKKSFKEIEARFSYKTRKVPVYEYETYTVIERNTTGEVKEVKKRRIVKQIGTKDEKFLARDPNGEIYKKIRMPIRDPKGGGLNVRNGIVAQNGMGLYAALKTGVPGDDSKIQEFMFAMNEILKHGLPDRTWDLAWITAAYVNLPNKKDTQVEMCKQMVNKIILGVNTAKGKGQGLWGPLCINPTILATMMEYQQKMAGKDQVKGKKKKEEGKADEKLEDIASFQDQFKNFSLLINIPPSTGKLRYYVNVGKTEAEPGIRVAYFPFYPYGENLTDMHSTAIAVFALHEAWKNGFLPQKTLMPQTDRKREIMKPLKVSTILETALAALLKEQNQSGGWSENHNWLPVHNFDRLSYPFLPVKDSDCSALKSNITPVSTCQGYMAVKFLADILGKSASISKPLAAAETLMKKDFDDLSKENFPLPDINDHPELLFQYLFFLSADEKMQGQILEVLLDEVVKVPTGKTQSEEIYVPDLLKQYFEKTLKRDFDRAQKLKGKKGEFTDKLKTTDLKQRNSWYGNTHFPNFMSQALALIIENKIARGNVPVAAYWPDAKNSLAKKMEEAVAKKILADSKIKPFIKGIGPLDLLQDKVLNNIPVLIASDPIPNEQVEKTGEILAEYAKTGGTVILLGDADNPNDGSSKLVKKIEELLPGVENKELTSETQLKVPCLVLDNVPVVLKVKIGKTDSDKEMKVASAVNLSMSVMKRKLGPQYKPAGSPEIDIIQLCQEINEKVAAEQKEKNNIATLEKEAGGAEAAPKKAPEDKGAEEEKNE